MTPRPLISESDLLIALLTTEGLLFAALAIAVGITGGSTFGPKTSLSPTALAFVSSAVLFAVGGAAVLAWTQLFGGAQWPAACTDRLEAIALLVAIVAQPVISLAVAIGIWRG
jgi:hypothetical protein